MKPPKPAAKKTSNALLTGTNAVLALVAVLVLLVVYFNLFGGSPSVSTDLTDDDPVKGDASAPVTLVEFSDYQCPACKAAEPVVAALLKKYPGSVKLVYRDFPLDSACNRLMPRQLHPYGCKAAVAANCALKQNRYWEMHDKLFAMQPQFDDASLKRYASELGLDAAAFAACLDANDWTEIQADIEAADKLGVNATPTFFVNGRKASTSQLEEFVASQLPS